MNADERQRLLERFESVVRGIVSQPRVENYCEDCGEHIAGALSAHQCSVIESDTDDGAFCRVCGAEVTSWGACLNDHDEESK